MLLCFLLSWRPCAILVSCNITLADSAVQSISKPKLHWIATEVSRIGRPAPTLATLVLNYSNQFFLINRLKYIYIFVGDFKHLICRHVLFLILAYAIRYGYIQSFGYFFLIKYWLQEISKLKVQLNL